MTSKLASAFALFVSYPIAVGGLAFVAACSSDSSGLAVSDGATDGRADVASKLDVRAYDGGGTASSGGSGGRLDAGNDGRSVAGTGGVGGTVALDGGGPATGGNGGRGGAGGSVVAGTGGRGSGGSAGSGGVIRGSGGTGIAGAVGTGGSDGAGAGGTGGSVTPDAATSLDVRLDVAGDVADGLIAIDADRLDLPSGRRDAAVADGPQCGELDEPCCEQQTCTATGTACSSGGAGGGTCVACGGDGQICCTNDVCTAPGTSCVSGGGRGAGTCR